MRRGQLTPADWRVLLDPSSVAHLYGPDPTVVAERLRLIERVLGRFAETFGEEPVRLFRSPGRINLRGMHVDTHGGYLNLMTHQREVVVAAAPATGPESVIANIDGAFEPAVFSISQTREHPAFQQDWFSFITHPDIAAETAKNRGHWSNYLRGCYLSVQHRAKAAGSRFYENVDAASLPRDPLREINAVVGSDLPRGAALSSSAALCTALILAILSTNEMKLTRDELILAARDAEWFTGARCGLSDQTAMIIGGQGDGASARGRGTPRRFINIAIHPQSFSTRGARAVAFPDALKILVINSYTERSLSGAAGVEYVRNRFAYSLAMEILRQEMARLGVPRERVVLMDRLANITALVDDVDGVDRGRCFLYQVLKSIPESLSLADLRERYSLPHLDESYRQFFGSTDEKLRPTEIALRGPLLFGIAESERARVFPAAIESGDFAAAGKLMTTGHDGDRRISANGQPFSFSTSNNDLDRFIHEGRSIESIPGAFGASSPVLDMLVDAALDAGALGASLTGAGIAGSVLALCKADDAESIASAIRARMAAPDYPRLSGRATSLTAEELANAVVINAATAPAGEVLTGE